MADDRMGDLYDEYLEPSYANRPQAIQKILLFNIDDEETREDVLKFVVEEYGEDTWKEKLLRMAADDGDFNVVDRLCDFVNYGLKPEDTLMMTKVLADPVVSKAYYGIIRDKLMIKLIAFSEDSKFIGNAEVTDNLRMTTANIMTLFDEQFTVESALEPEKDDLFNSIRALVLYSPESTQYVMDLMSENNEVFNKNIYEQVMEMIVNVNQGRFDQVRNHKYIKPDYVPIHPHDNGGYYFWDELPQRPDSVMEMEKTLLNLEQPLVSAKEAPYLAAGILRRDLAYMREQLSKYPGGDVMFRALIIRNPSDKDGPPLLLIRPNVDFDFGRKYLNGNGHDEFHQDIWDGWVIKASENPDSDRAKIVRLILSAGGYKELEHIYMDLRGGEAGASSLEIRSGWSLFSNDEDSNTFVNQMAIYGINTVAIGNSRDDKVMVEKMILADEVEILITQNAEKLSRILPQRSVNRYKRLARKYLTDPRADKSVRAYQVLKDYEGLVNKV